MNKSFNVVKRIIATYSDNSIKVVAENISTHTICGYPDYDPIEDDETLRTNCEQYFNEVLQLHEKTTILYAFGDWFTGDCRKKYEHRIENFDQVVRVNEQSFAVPIV